MSRFFVCSSVVFLFIGMFGFLSTDEGWATNAVPEREAASLFGSENDVKGRFKEIGCGGTSKTGPCGVTLHCNIHDSFDTAWVFYVWVIKEEEPQVCYECGNQCGTWVDIWPASQQH